MESDNLLVLIALIAVVISAFGFSMTYNSVSSFQNYLTGYAVENGTINLTISPQVAINITHANESLGDDLNWGSGYVESSQATLISNGTVIGGTWNPVVEGFRIVNIGNTDITNLTVHADKNASTFIGDGAVFQYNLTNYADESNSCSTWESGQNNTWVDFTTSPVEVCDLFTSINTNDTIRMDIRLVIPSGATNGEKTTFVRLTYT